MAVTIKRGNSVINDSVTKAGSKSDEEVSKVTIVKAAPTRPVTEKTVNGVSVGKKQVKDDQPKKVDETKVDSRKEESKEEKVETTKEVVDNNDKVVISPVSFNNDLKKDNYEPDKSTPVYDIEKATSNILENISKIKIDDIKVEAMEGLLNKLSKSDVDRLSIFKLLIKTAVGVYDSIDSLADQAILDDYLVGFISKNYELIASVDDSGDKIKVNAFLGTEFEWDQETDNRTKVMTFDKEFDKTVIATTESKDEEKNKEQVPYEGLACYSGKIMKSTDIIPSMKEEYDVLVAIDDDGNIVADNTNYIVGIDMVDEQYVGDTTIVSKKWLDNILKENESINPTPEKIDLTPKKPVAESNEKEAPVGALPPQNNIEESKSMEEFLEEENNSEE